MRQQARNPPYRWIAAALWLLAIEGLALLTMLLAAKGQMPLTAHHAAPAVCGNASAGPGGSAKCLPTMRFTVQIVGDGGTVVDLRMGAPVLLQRCVGRDCGPLVPPLHLPLKVNAATLGGPAGAGVLFGVQGARPYEVDYTDASGKKMTAAIAAAPGS